MPIEFSVFTKPWKVPLPDLGKFVAGLGFDGVEFPVRPGYQVEPEHIGRDLPGAAETLAEHGVRIASVATLPTPEAIAACARLGIPVIRVMAANGADGYRAAEARIQ